MNNIIDSVLDPGVKHALMNLTQEIQASNNSPERSSAKFEITIEIQDTSINLSDQSLPSSSGSFFVQPRDTFEVDRIDLPFDCDILSQKEICQRQGKTPVVIIRRGEKIVVCC
jgi:hypothetical protein